MVVVVHRHKWSSDGGLVHAEGRLFVSCRTACTHLMAGVACSLGCGSEDGRQALRRQVQKANTAVCAASTKSRGLGPAERRVCGFPSSRTLNHVTSKKLGAVERQLPSSGCKITQPF